MYELTDYDSEDYESEAIEKLINKEYKSITIKQYKYLCGIYPYITAGLIKRLYNKNMKCYYCSNKHEASFIYEGTIRKVCMEHYKKEMTKYSRELYDEENI